MATKTVKIDLDGESGKLWMNGAGTALRAKRARQGYNYCKKSYGSKDPRTLQALAERDAAIAAAEAAELAWKQFAGIE